MNDELDETDDDETCDEETEEPEVHCFSVAGHSGEESLHALRVAQELSNVLAPIYRHLFEIDDPTEPEAVKGVFMLIDLLVKLYSVGFHMGMDAESGYLEKYERLLEGVRGTYKRHELQ